MISEQKLSSGSLSLIPSTENVIFRFQVHKSRKKKPSSFFKCSMQTRMVSCISMKYNLTMTIVIILREEQLNDDDSNNTKEKTT